MVTFSVKCRPGWMGRGDGDGEGGVGGFCPNLSPFYGRLLLLLLLLLRHRLLRFGLLLFLRCNRELLNLLGNLCYRVCGRWNLLGWCYRFNRRCNSFFTGLLLRHLGTLWFLLLGLFLVVLTSSSGSLVLGFSSSGFSLFLLLWGCLISFLLLPGSLFPQEAKALPEAQLLPQVGGLGFLLLASTLFGFL